VSPKPKKPRKNAALRRSIRLLREPGPGGVGLMCIADRRQASYYTFKELPCDIGGRAFALHRLGLGNLYHVRVGTIEQCSCECLGFLRHQRCKHVMGLLALTGHRLV
jgi:hypothetical protein